jgi:protein-S-isoprenylcysteine O-methyltransferase Ste14
LADFRARGGAWVVAQVALFGTIAVVWLVGPRWPARAERPLQVAGAVLAAAGLALAIGAYRALGRAFTALPAPRTDGVLATGGPYRLVRHPMYAGGLAFLVGVSLAATPWALVPTGVLALLWWRKAALEERLLAARAPAYTEYAVRTRRRFVPWRS